jgi:hypothetical protein
VIGALAGESLAPCPFDECFSMGEEILAGWRLRGPPAGPRAGEGEMAISWQATELVQCVSVRPWLKLPDWDEPGGCDDLTLGRIYEMLGVEADGAFYRILDDSGDDFLYPASHFKVI